LAGNHAKLHFDQQGAADSYFQVDESANGARVTWGFDTDLLEGQSWFGGLLARYFGLFFDRWIGTDYEMGLANLKALIESMPPADFSDLEVELIEVEPANILYVKNLTQGSADLDAGLAAAYREITTFMADNEIEMAAQPMAITRIRANQGYDVEAAIPVLTKDVEPSGRVMKGQSPAGRALRVVHRGSYDSMAPDYDKLAAFMAAHDLAEGSVSWEHYISNPAETPGEELITHIYFLLEDGQ
jgi:effector-binding domain-containing protein